MAISNSILISDHRYRFQPVIRMPEDNDSMQVSFATVCSTKIVATLEAHGVAPASCRHVAVAATAGEPARRRRYPNQHRKESGLTSDSHRKHRIFLLSPANLAGIRAGYVLKAAASDLACRLRQNGVTLG